MTEHETQPMSPEMSFNGFEILKLIKGNRKAIVAGIGYLLSMALSDAQWVNFLSAGGFAVLYSIIEFYFKPVVLK